MNYLNSLGQWTQPYLADIALALVATLLVIYGDDINKAVTRKIGKKNFLVRFGVFIALCTFGYGLLTVHITRWVTFGLSRIPTEYLVLGVLGAFVILGILAERKNQV